MSRSIRTTRMFAQSFVALLRESDVRSQDNIGARGHMACEFRAACETRSGTQGVKEFAREFTAEVRAVILKATRGAERQRLLNTATVRCSEAKRIYVAFLKKDAAAARVYEGSLSVVAFLKRKAKASKPRKVVVTLKQVRKQANVLRQLLRRVSKEDRARALSLLANVVQAVKR